MKMMLAAKFLICLLYIYVLYVFICKYVLYIFIELSIHINYVYYINYYINYNIFTIITI